MDKLFCYLVDFGSVSSGGTYTGQIDFATDSDFELKAIRSDLTSTTEGKVTVTRDGGEALSNAAFSLRAIAGSNNALNFFDKLTFLRGSKLNFSVVISAGSAQALQIQLWGVKK